MNLALPIYRTAGHCLPRPACNVILCMAEGGTIGPDTTPGSDRENLDYLLLRLIDPAAVVRKEYLLHTLQLQSGRVLSGIV